MEYEALPNSNANNLSGAGIAAAQELVNRGIKTVLTGSFGPNASSVLSRAGIEMMTGAEGIVKEALEDYKNGELAIAPSIPINQNYGYGRGIGGGRGAGMGMGRGMSRGMGRGLGRSMEVGMGRRMEISTSNNKIRSDYQLRKKSQNDEKDALKKHIRDLEDQLRVIKKKLEEIS
jgi:predicted Fe-Mo cluster-binding NifX family protein